MKIFVFGSTGMLGTYVYKYLSGKNYSVIPLTRKQANISKITEESLINSSIKKGDIVINCAGLIKQRPSTKEYDFVMVNALFPHILFKVCEAKGAKLIHISTDCVFNGLTGEYDEKCIHNATDIYGRSKSLGEPTNATIIRTSIIGEEKNNFLSLLEWVRSNKDGEVNGFTNHYWNGITCLKFAEICEYIIENNLFWNSVKHLFSPTIVSKYDLVCLISDIYELNIKVNPIEAPITCNRSLTSIRSDILIPIEDLKIQLQKLKNFKI